MDQWTQFRSSALMALADAKKEGKADERAFRLMDEINRNPAYATTSSCSGRAMLLSLEKHKKDARIEGRWHGRISGKGIKKAVESYGGRKSLWLKLEPFILHVACRDIDAGMALMLACKDAGLKRFGLQAMRGGKRCLAEIIGTGKMDIPLGACAVDYAKFARLANLMMAQNWKRMEKLRQRIKLINAISRTSPSAASSKSQSSLSLSH